MTRVDSLFDVTYGNKLDMNKMQQADRASGTAFVGRRRVNQGVAGFVAPLPGVPPYPPGLLTVALGGNPLASFVQQRPFYTAQNVAVLRPRDPEMPLAERLYYALCIRHNAFRYTAFGREANRTLGTIDLPRDVPAWVYETPMPTHAGLTAPAGPEVALSDPGSWRDFTLSALFEIKKGMRLTKAARRPGPVRFIGASEKHNGITDRSDVVPTFSGGQLTVAYNGNSVGWAFYQDRPFFASDDVNVLEPREPVPVPALLFVAAVIKHGKSRYTYGYKWTLERMCNTAIRLPTTPTGKPDWAYMEAYMRSLPFSGLVAAAELASETA
jgi:Type I restriction modification DNA specificity domain